MPTIEFRSPISKPVDLMLLMMYPDNETLREKAFALNQISFILHTSGEDEDKLLSVRKGDLAAVLDLAERDVVREDQEERTRKGMLAGDLLNSIFLMERFDLKPSLGRGIYALQGWAGTATYGDGSPMVTSETAIRNCWKQFSSVAHFWGALRINQSYPYAPYGQVFTPEHLPTMLEVAATLYDFAVTFVPIRARPPDPIVSATAAWGPPTGTVRRKLNSDRFPAGLRELLKDYKAPTPHLP